MSAEIAILVIFDLGVVLNWYAPVKPDRRFVQ